MMKSLQNWLKTKHYLVFDFDRTLAKMEIDWSNWHTGIAGIYFQFDQNHGYEFGKNPHNYHNKLIKLYGDPLLTQVRTFSQEYESEHVTGFTPNTELIDFVKKNKTHTLFVFSSNSRSTVLKGLEKLGIVDSFEKIISKDDVTYVKTDPEGFYLIENFSKNKSAFLMIGDSKADRDAARAAGIDFLECNMFEKFLEED